MKQLKIFICLLLTGTSVWAASKGKPGDLVQFNKDIRGILSDNCFYCHGPDKNTRKAKYRLDLEDAAKADLGGYFGILPGQPDKSEMIRRITTDNPDDLMPPPDSGKHLTPAQKEMIKKWVQQGAKWESHWAYYPPKKEEPPKTKNKSWASNPIDHFILSRLEKEKLSPSPEADRRTLIRRLSMDLTGLPPSAEEVREFVQDKRTDAYERVVDRLLGSVHFGERMAVHWLDLVRYADTVGYHGDQPYNVFPYRDYVIKAFNDNMRFDRFTIENLAGDLLPNATTEQKIASAYNRLNMITAEGGAQPKEYLVKYAADRVRTTSSVWLGATLGCAECHDHKFDPFTTKDFYRFSAFFADLKEQGYYGGAHVTGSWGPEISLPTPEQVAELKKMDDRVTELTTRLDTTSEPVAAAQWKWETLIRRLSESNHLAWATLKPESATSSGGSTLTIQEDSTIVASGTDPEKDNYSVTLTTDREFITAIRLDALKDDAFASKSLSRGPGNFVLTEFEVEVTEAGSTNAKPVKIASGKADHTQGGFPIENAFDGKSDTGWAVEGATKKENRKAAFILAHPIVGGPGTKLTIRLKHESTHKQHTIGKFKLSLISVERPTLDDHGLPNDIAEAIKMPLAQRTPEQRDKVAKYYRGISPVLDNARKDLAETKTKRDDYKKIIDTCLISEKTDPREIRILPRGNWMDNSGEVVTPGVPGFLAQSLPQTNDRQTRLDLAKWFVSKENPLTARVFVNRLWKIYFGTGLSKVLDDIGSQGERPVHPELLDWLAAEFMDSGWDVKHVIRLIVTSRTYRQSSESNKTLDEKDPFNRLLARQSRFRYEAELVRDQALAVSGLLQTKVGGRSARPYQPPGYWAQLNFPVREYENDKGQNQYRRGLYTHWQRTFLHPAMKAFDAPTREECTASRVSSNTPLQALVLLNDPSFVEAARVFAEKVIRLGGAKPESKITYAFEQALNRPPLGKEIQILEDLYEKQKVRYAKDEDAAKKLLATGDTPVAKDIPAAELAAWTAVTRSIFNLHETIVRN